MPGDDQQEIRRFTITAVHPFRDRIDQTAGPSLRLGQSITVADEQATRRSARAEALEDAAELERALRQLHDATERWSHFNGVATARKRARAALESLASEEGRHSDG